MALSRGPDIYKSISSETEYIILLLTRRFTPKGKKAIYDGSIPIKIAVIVCATSCKKTVK